MKQTDTRWAAIQKENEALQTENERLKEGNNILLQVSDAKKEKLKNKHKLCLEEMEERLRKEQSEREKFRASKRKGEWDAWAAARKPALDEEQNIIAGEPNCSVDHLVGLLEIIRRTNPQKEILDLYISVAVKKDIELVKYPFPKPCDVSIDRESLVNNIHEMHQKNGKLDVSLFPVCPFPTKLMIP